MAERWKIATLVWQRSGSGRYERAPDTVTGYADGSGLAFFAVPCVKCEWRIIHTASGYELSQRATFRTMRKAQKATEAVVALNLDFNRPRSEFGAVTGNAVYAVLRKLGCKV